MNPSKSRLIGRRVGVGARRSALARQNSPRRMSFGSRIACWSVPDRFRQAQQHPRSEAIDLGDLSVVRKLTGAAVIVRRQRRTITRRQAMVSMVALCPTSVW